MSGLRLAFVTRRFWPLVGENELLVASLGEQLLKLGHQPVIVTPKYGKHWPNQVCVRAVPVVRLPHPPPRTWGNVRYSFAVSRWLQLKQNELDAVIIGGPPDDGLTALGALRSSKVAVVVQQELGGEADVTPRRFGDQLLRRLTGCDAFIGFNEADEPSTQPHWVGLNRAVLPVEKLHQIDLGIALPAARTPASKLAARQSLAEVNHDLAASGFVALCLAPLSERSHLETLIRAWRPVQARFPESRLWVIGDGPARGSLFSLLSDFDLKYRVVLPGTFDDWDVLTQAADLLVVPQQATSPGLAQLHAMAAGLPTIVYRATQTTSPLPEAGRAETVAELLHVHHAEGPQQLASSLIHLVDHPDLAIRMGEQARKQVAGRHQLSTMVEHYVRLLKAIVQQRHPSAGPA